MARLILHSKETQALVIDLQPGLNRLGRNIINDFQINDPSVSSCHCEICLADGQVTVRDLESTNGTFIGGKQIEEGILTPGQTLKLGNIELLMETGQFEVKIPELPKTTVAPVRKQVVLPKGIHPCENHFDSAAGYKCNQCGKLLCTNCVRRIKLVGSKEKLFCTSCKGSCTALPNQQTKSRTSFLGRITQTIKIFSRK
jgi:pSer/pThr/pTyr-binding forkhead associated (FHA) protein